MICPCQDLLNLTLYKTEDCRVRTAHQPLKEQRAFSVFSNCLTKETLGTHSLKLPYF